MKFEHCNDHIYVENMKNQRKIYNFQNEQSNPKCWEIFCIDLSEFTNEFSFTL